MHIQSNGMTYTSDDPLGTKGFVVPVNNELVLSIERANTDMLHTLVGEIFVPFALSTRNQWKLKYL